MGDRKGSLEDLDIVEKFWSRKKVLLTGHSGFKGTWLSIWLKMLGADLVGYSLAPPSTPSMFESLKMERQMESVMGDIRDLANLESLFSRVQPEIAIHLAAQSLVLKSYQDPVETYLTNVMGTVNFLEAVRKTPSVRVAVVISSDKCYQNNEWLWGYREVDRMGGYDPYASSKGCAELVTSAYRYSFFGTSHGSRETFIASARAGNVFGGGDWADYRLVPDVMRAFLKKEKVEIRHPDAIRPWQFVLEPLRGYLLLTQKLWEKGSDFSEPWNFGPDHEDEKSVSEVVTRLVKNWGTDAGWTRLHDPNPLHESRFLKLDSSKARLRLGWKSKLDLDTAIMWTSAWYKAYQDKQDLLGFTQSQIDRYQQI